MGDTTQEGGGTLQHVESAVETGVKTFSDVTSMAEAALAAAQGHGDLIQEIVNFLHRIFPGHGAPGTPTSKPSGE